MMFVCNLIRMALVKVMSSWELDSEGRWEYNKGKLSITYYDDEEGTTTDVGTVKELTTSRLVIESYDIDEEWEESYALLTFKKIK